MFCNKCGNEINEGAAFCAKCGNRIANVMDATALGSVSNIHNEEVVTQMEIPVKEAPTQQEDVRPERHALGLCSHEDMLSLMKRYFIDIASPEYKKTIQKTAKGKALAVTINSPDGKFNLWIQGALYSKGRRIAITNNETNETWNHEYLLVSKFAKGVKALCN